MKVGRRTDAGQVRKANEDSYRVDEEHGIFIVADGMGGHNAGDVASKLAVEIIARTIADRGSDSGADSGKAEDIEKLLQDAIGEANSEIYRRAQENRELKGMGTTVILTYFVGDQAYIAHVGDSRAYILRGAEMRQLMEDHSLVADLLKEGKISEEEAHAYPRRHVITRAVGNKESVEAAITSLAWRRGDYLLLCSDGLTDMVQDEEIRDTTLSVEDPQRICDCLIDLANRNGGLDNITAVVLYLGGGESRG